MDADGDGDGDADGYLSLEEDTDLREDELDEDISGKMSIRAINVGTMHRFSPGSMTLGRRVSNGGQSNVSKQNSKVGNKSSMLLRASNLLVNQRMSRVS